MGRNNIFMYDKEKLHGRKEERKENWRKTNSDGRSQKMWTVMIIQTLKITLRRKKYPSPIAVVFVSISVSELENK